MPKHKHREPFDVTTELRDLPTEPRLGKESALPVQRQLWARTSGGRKKHQFHFFCPEDVTKQIRHFCVDNNISHALFFTLAAEEFLEKRK